MAAIKTDGTLWTWGNNSKGQLGNNTCIATGAGVSSPVQVVGAATTWCQVSGLSFAFAAIKTNGTLWTWGYAICGQLGDGTSISKSSPVQISSGATTWKQVSNSVLSPSGLATKTDGTLWSWGCNNSGQLGDGTTIDRCAPVQVLTCGSGAAWVEVNGGVAIKTDRTLWTWGCNNFGQLGDGTTISKSSPVQTIAGGTNWLSGPIFKVFNTSSPVQTICGGTTWCQVSISGGSVIAVKTDGTLWS